MNIAIITNNEMRRTEILGLIKELGHDPIGPMVGADIVLHEGVDENSISWLRIQSPPQVDGKPVGDTRLAILINIQGLGVESIRSELEKLT